MKLSPEMVTCVSVGKPNIKNKTLGMYGKLEKHGELIMI